MPRETRNRTRAAALAAGAIATALLIAGCSSPGAAEERGDAGSAGSSLPAGEGTTDYPLTLRTPYGETILEERPERIAIVGGLGELEAVLSLGVSPVVTPWESTDWSWLGPLADQLDEAVLVDPWADALAVEAILAAEPDLIVALTHGALETDYDRLADIAPVLGKESEDDIEWHGITESLGEALDLSGAADEVIAVTEQHVADAVAEHPQYEGKTVGIMINRGEEAGLEFVNRSGSPAEEILSTLGFAPHPEAEVFSDSDWGDVSMENLSLVEADGLVIARHGGNGTAEEANAWLEGSALYQSRPAHWTSPGPSAIRTRSRSRGPSTS
jgi:iron complex transport system substrate-binding protein